MQASSKSSRLWLLLGTITWLTTGLARGDDLPVVVDVEFQPLSAQVKRVVEAMEMLGEPLAAEEKGRLDRALESTGSESAVRTIQEVLDRHCLIGIEINPESRVKAVQGPARPRLIQSGWSVFLVKVHNEAGVTAKLAAVSPNAEPVYKVSSSRPDPKPSISPGQIVQRWADVAMFNDRPLKPSLSGLGLEYRIMQVYSRDAGRREAKISFNVGQGTQDLGFRSDVDILFQVDPAVPVVLDVRDEDGRPTMASFIFRDRAGAGLPVARAVDSLRTSSSIPRSIDRTARRSCCRRALYEVEVTRGPEYLVHKQTIDGAQGPSRITRTFRLKRWINLAKMNWYSGDHHVHAAGCAHYESPTEGSSPRTCGGTSWARTSTSAACSRGGRAGMPRSSSSRARSTRCRRPST